MTIVMVSHDMEEIGKYADRVAVINQKSSLTATPRLGISIIITGGVTMTEFLSALRQPFMLRALIVGVVISICAALLGVILVLKRYALIGHGLADIGFASLSLAIALGWSPLYVSMPIVAAASFAIMLISQKSGVQRRHGNRRGFYRRAVNRNNHNLSCRRHERGRVQLYVRQHSRHHRRRPLSEHSPSDLSLSLPFILLYNRLFMVTYDEVYAKACGINVTLYQFFISLLTAVTVVIGMRMMGTLLIASLIIFPP